MIAAVADNSGDCNAIPGALCSKSVVKVCACVDHHENYQQQLNTNLIDLQIFFAGPHCSFASGN